MAYFLPMNKQEMAQHHWTQCDFVYILGDAYVDHPSFGHAIISRVLERAGYKVGIISQPDWKDPKSVTALGKPKYGFLVMAGNMDSMVNHYSVFKHRRKTDAYTPGGVTGKRPDYATVVYCNLIRQAYKETAVIIGGMEASLRRLAHYDYWSDKLKRSVLLDSQADLLLYGMGERSVVQVADALKSGLSIHDITFIDGTVYRAKSLEDVTDALVLPAYDELLKDKKNYAKSFYTQYINTDPYAAKRLAEPYSDHEFVVQNPPQKPLTTQELDDVYDLPYLNTYHPSYKAAGGVPAIAEVKFSLTSCRGCFGGCSFCSLTFHQGRIIQARSHESILKEAVQMTHAPDFKGYIHDVGGPTANFRQPACRKQTEKGACPEKQCLYPTPCKNLIADHSDYLALLHELRKLPGVKKVFIRSGIRFDYLLADKDDSFFRELVQHHISGQLRVAPEHVSDEVLSLMGKPKNSVYKRFMEKYKKLNEQEGLQQFAVPYLMSSHPGSTMKSAVELAEHIRDMGYNPEQVQDFYPTPSTISTVMYYTGLDPRTLKPVYVPKDPHEKAMQRALIQYRDPKNYALVHEALLAAGRADLIGSGDKCLIRPKKGEGPDKKSQKVKKPHKSVPSDKKQGRPEKRLARPSKDRQAGQFGKQDKPSKGKPSRNAPQQAAKKEPQEAQGVQITPAMLAQAERYLKKRKKRK